MSLSRTFPVHPLVLVLALCLLSAATSQARIDAQTGNPIGRIARVVNPKLNELESRIVWLEGRLRYLSAYNPKSLQRGLGWRGGQLRGADTPPSLTLDLGETYSLNDIYVVPSQPQTSDGKRLFPLEMRVEAALDPDFKEGRVIYETRDGSQEEQEGYPLRIVSHDIDARYVRLTVLLGHHQGNHSISAISELVVVSGGEPVSIHAEVESENAMSGPGRWEPQFAIDGRTPLGSWEGGAWINSRGSAIGVPAADAAVEWLVDLGKSEPIDRVTLFPYELPEFGGTSILPSDLSISVGDDPEGPFRTIRTLTGGEAIAPMVVPLARTSGRYVRVRSAIPFTIGDFHLHGLSELEIWSHGRNLAPDVRIIRRDPRGSTLASPQLTDGYGNGLKILQPGLWLRQLSERREIEDELAELGPLRHNMATEAEINTTWGASIAIGLTFLIPIAFVERRRLVSKSHLEKLRKRIASDLHDDIGSNLGSISLIARSAMRDLGRRKDPDALPAHLAEDLSELESIARESSLAMRDIVWLLEQRGDTLDDFVKRMRDTAGRLLRELEYDFTCRSNRTALRMTLDAKRHLFLFYKESLHNILKHSGATKVRIRVHDAGPDLVMEVEDNGVGLPVDAVGQPKGVRKLTDRAAVLEGRLRIESQKNRGTHLHLRVRRSNLIATTKTSP
jgi:signal transduction histidine kinase